MEDNGQTCTLRYGNIGSPVTVMWVQILILPSCKEQNWTKDVLEISATS